MPDWLADIAVYGLVFAVSVVFMLTVIAGYEAERRDNDEWDDR